MATGDAEVVAHPLLFTFRGLSYLYHIEHIRVVPLGYDKKGIKYFEINDATENVPLFTAEITELDEDLVVKDKYGIIRFCLHGWASLGQLDVYVSIDRPIGIVKDQVFYNQIKSPMFAARLTTTGPINCIGTPYIKVESLTEDADVAYVFADSSSIEARFDQFMDEGPKALIVSYCLQLALAKYKMLNLHLPKIRYVYKDRPLKKEAIKPRKKTIGSSGPPVIYTPIPVAVPTPALSKRQSDPKPQVIVVQTPAAPQPKINMPPIQVIVPASAEKKHEFEMAPPIAPTVAGGPPPILVSITKRKHRVDSEGNRHSFSHSGSTRPSVVRQSIHVTDVGTPPVSSPGASRYRASRADHNSAATFQTFPSARKMSAPARSATSSLRQSIPDHCRVPENYIDSIS